MCLQLCRYHYYLQDSRVVTVPERAGWLQPLHGLKGPSRYPVVVDYKVLLTCHCSGLFFLNHSSSAVTLCGGAVWGDGDLLEVCTVFHLLAISQYL